MKIRVRVYTPSALLPFRDYVMDHSSDHERKVLGQQCANAFAAGQAVVTHPVGSRRLSKRFDRLEKQKKPTPVRPRWFGLDVPSYDQSIAGFDSLTEGMPETIDVGRHQS